MGLATMTASMAETKAPDLTLSLTWLGGQRLDGVSKENTISIDGTGKTAPSPVQTLAFSLGSCMSIDVVDVLEKGRLPLKALICEMRVFRDPQTPRRIVGVELHFNVRGEIEGDRVERAIALSRDKYCSVWHSMNPSIDLKTSFTVNP